jgi:group I intron endonuclease
MKDVSGIYRITNCNNGKKYIGQSKGIFKRWKSHTQALPTSSPKSLIQKAFNKYGLLEQVSKPGIYSNFKFEIVEEVNEESLLDREYYYISKEMPEYNIALMPPNSDISQLQERVRTNESRLIVQYHNYAREGHFPGFGLGNIDWKKTSMSEVSHWISTKKRTAIYSKGDEVLLIMGIKHKRKVRYVLWSTTIVEEISFFPGEDLPINVIGQQKFYMPMQLLNDLEGFEEFKKRCGNFAYGFQPIRKTDPFFDTIVSFSKKNILTEEMTIEEYYDNFIDTYFPDIAEERILEVKRIYVEIAKERSELTEDELIIEAFKVYNSRINS